MVFFYDAAGNFSWAKNMAASVSFDGNGRNGIAMDGFGNIYIAGDFSDTCDVDPGSGTYTLASSGGYEAFITKLGQSIGTTGMASFSQAPGLRVYPNPASDGVTIQADQLVGEERYTITDQAGRLVQSGILQDTRTKVSLSNLAAGFYILQVHGNSQTVVKIVKQ